MAKYISTKETAVLLRQALKAAFPGTKFSVRKSTGTASSWINVSWEDGPTTQAVDAITDTYEGSKFNGMTDSYDQMPDQLIAFSADEMPEEVRFGCSGILTHRDMGEEGKRAALAVLIENNRTMNIVNAEGGYNEKLNKEVIPSLYAGEYRLWSPYDLPQATWQVFSQLNLQKVVAKK